MEAEQWYIKIKRSSHSVLVRVATKFPQCSGICNLTLRFPLNFSGKPCPCNLLQRFKKSSSQIEILLAAWTSYGQFWQSNFVGSSFLDTARLKCSWIIGIAWHSPIRKPYYVRSWKSSLLNFGYLSTEIKISFSSVHFEFPASRQYFRLLTAPSPPTLVDLINPSVRERNLTRDENTK